MINSARFAAFAFVALFALIASGCSDDDFASFDDCRHLSPIFGKVWTTAPTGAAYHDPPIILIFHKTTTGGEVEILNNSDRLSFVFDEDCDIVFDDNKKTEICEVGEKTLYLRSGDNILLFYTED